MSNLELTKEELVEAVKKQCEKIQACRQAEIDDILTTLRSNATDIILKVDPWVFHRIRGLYYVLEVAKENADFKNFPIDTIGTKELTEFLNPDMNLLQAHNAYICLKQELDYGFKGAPAYSASFKDLERSTAVNPFGKEAPMKVLEATAYQNTRAVKCPICNKRYSMSNSKKYVYCPHCGQKLDWSDKHE